MVSEVLNHMHPGGTDPAAPVPAGAAAIAKSLKRKRKTAALVLKYAAPEATSPALRALLRTAGDDGEAMWDLYQATEIGAQAESSAETIKTEMRNASILGTVGFMRGSVSAFAQFLTEYRTHYRITGGEEVKKFDGVEAFRDKATGYYSLNQALHQAAP